jgi:hypothetical protein
MTASTRDDVLARAARLLREEQDEAMVGADMVGVVPIARDPTWWRIMNDVRRARRRRRWMSVIALHLGIGLTGMAVWATVTGHLTTFVRIPASFLATSPRETRLARPRRPSSIAIAPARAPENSEPLPATATATAEPPTAAPARPTSAPMRLAEAHGGPAKLTASRSVEAPPIEQPSRAADALYREAHQLHFVRRDFAASLAAWDRYLAVGPGPLVVEGRYNRAIALAHLGRRAEAVLALRPFADGETGAYRRQEARALIEKLSAAP